MLNVPRWVICMSDTSAKLLLPVSILCEIGYHYFPSFLPFASGADLLLLLGQLLLPAHSYYAVQSTCLRTFLRQHSPDNRMTLSSSDTSCTAAGRLFHLFSDLSDDASTRNKSGLRTCTFRHFAARQPRGCRTPNPPPTASTATMGTHLPLMPPPSIGVSRRTADRFIYLTS